MLFATLTSVAALLLVRASSQEIVNSCLEGGKAGQLDWGELAEKKCDNTEENYCLTLAVMESDGNGDPVNIRRCATGDWEDCEEIQKNQKQLLVDKGVEMMSCSTCKGKNCNKAPESTAEDPQNPNEPKPSNPSEPESPKPSNPNGPKPSNPAPEAGHKHGDDKATKKKAALGKEGAVSEKGAKTTNDSTGVTKPDVFAVVVLVTFSLLRFVV